MFAPIPKQRLAKQRLLLTNIFPPAIGGPATFMSYLARYLADQGDDVTVVCSTESRLGPPPPPYRPSVKSTVQPAPKVGSLSVKRFNLDSRYRYEIELRVALALRLLQHRTALINGLDSYALPIARAIGRRTIVKVVGDSVWERARNHGFTSLDIDAFQRASLSQGEFFAARQAQTTQLLRASVIVTPSEYLKHMVVGWGIPSERVTVVPNSYSPEIDTEVGFRPRAPRSSEPMKLLFVGRLTNWKGIETALLALRLITDRVTTIAPILTVCGDGPLYPTAQSLARQLGIAHQVKFLGRVAHLDVIKALSEHHALILTSLYEGLSHTLLDAFAAGLPVIASSCGGNRELVQHRENGMLIEPENPELLAITIEQLCRHELWSSISAASRRSSVAYAQERVASQYRALLDDLELGVMPTGAAPLRLGGHSDSDSSQNNTSNNPSQRNTSQQSI